MHENNRRWLTDLRAAYPEFFHGARVLEIGSRIWGTSSDTIRPFFTECAYIGVDKEHGPGVNIVCDARETNIYQLNPDRRGERIELLLFDTLAIFSVFEHEPDWASILIHNIQWLRPGGLFITCFGAEGNQHHAPEPWAPVLHAEFLKHCVQLGLVVMDAFFEEERYGPNCAGCYNVIAGKPLMIRPDVVDDVV